MTGWIVALIVIAAIIGAYFAISLVLKAWGASRYDFLKKNTQTNCDIDTFVGEQNPPAKFKVALVNKLRIGNRQARFDPVPLECTPSPHVQGLYVSRAQKKDATDAPTPLGDLLPRVQADGTIDPNDSKKTIIVATIRMGFGHHRLAYSACSWALEQGYTTIFHDLINIECDESKLIGSADSIYSKMSRLSSEMGGPIEYLWGKAMKQGDANGLRVAALEAAHMQPLLLGYPKDIPIIATHQLVALTAAAAGFTNVINLVVDNYPQWFLVVPKTLNCTQGPVNYQAFLRMGVQPDQVRLAGHWCPTGLVKNLEADCKARMARAKASPLKARRLLVPVGGAGAQKKFIVGMLEQVKNLVKEGKLQLFLNAGDHAHMKAAFVEVLEKCGLEYDTVSTTQGVYDFQKKLLGGAEPDKAVTLFAFEDYFPAVATTDILGRVADVLTCKPSELAFYPLPKLHIRRVGDHEADSARRAAEVGDGSMEARELEDAMRYIQLFLATPDLLVSMNEQVLRAHQIGLYNGCKNAVDWAMGGSV
eukprot:Nitzschia sp. Nitz4//scaffold247_size31676//27739//29465//NITZ4_007933-RA/size31676-augustus-gene-0.31-mRNA-1//-1//CDS//3329543964//7829//frame0